ncbi:MAG: hypothetical protein V8S98_00420 [Lachnospiraceae bacterium]
MKLWFRLIGAGDCSSIPGGGQPVVMGLRISMEHCSSNKGLVSLCCFGAALRPAREIALETDGGFSIFLWDLCISGADRDEVLAVEKGKYRSGVERCDGCHSPVFLCMDTGGASGTVFLLAVRLEFLGKGNACVSSEDIFSFLDGIYSGSRLACWHLSGLYAYDNELAVA